MDSPYSSPNDSTTSLEVEAARSTHNMSLISIGLALTGNWTCYVTAVLGLVLGVVTLSRANAILAEEIDETTEAYARAARSTALIAVVYCAMLVLIIVAIIGLYALLFGGLVLAEGL